MKPMPKLNVHKLIVNCSCGKTNEYEVELSGEAINTELLEALKSITLFDAKYVNGEEMDAVDEMYNRKALKTQALKAIAKAEGQV